LGPLERGVNKTLDHREKPKIKTFLVAPSEKPDKKRPRYFGTTWGNGNEKN